MVTPFSLKADNDSEGQTVPMTFTDATSLEKISNDSNVKPAISIYYQSEIAKTKMQHNHSLSLTDFLWKKKIKPRK